MRVLSLFSGGGLGDFGLELAGMQIVGQVEIDKYCQKILSLRWPEVPKRRNIKRIKGEKFFKECGKIDLVAGGFPCQPFSFAGRRKGEKDSRNLWPEMYRIIKHVRPRWVLAENVPGVLGYLEAVVLPQLEGEGYFNYTERGAKKIAPLIVPASAFGAPHRRDRVWIIAHALREQGIGKHARGFLDKSAGIREVVADPASGGRERGIAGDFGIDQETQSQGGPQASRTSGCGQALADPYSPIMARTRSQPKQTRSSKFSDDGQISHTARDSWWLFDRERQENGTYWSTEPNVGRVAHGTPKRVDRLKLLGNGQFVQNQIFNGKMIMEFENQ